MGHQEIRVPPQNLDAEKAVLGAMLIEDDAIGEVIELLDSSYFYESAHQRIFEAIVRLYSTRKNVDTITLSDQLTADGALEAVGGVSYLTELVDFVPTAANVVHYAGIVKEKGIKRRLIKNATEIVARSFDADADVEELVDTAEKLIFEIASARQKQQATAVKDIVKKTIQTIDDLYHHKKVVTGVPTGFFEFDKLTSGLQNSDLIIVAARPSMGKSALAASISEYASIEKGVPVAFFSLEMSKEQVVMRMLCSQARVNAANVRTGMLAQSEWPLLTRAAAKLSTAPFFIDDTPAISPLELRAKARRLKTAHDIGLVVVDYLQLMRGSTRAENRQQEISEISRSLKALARELRVPVIAISQLSRAVESRTDHKPQLSDLRESGAIEQDADVVVLLMREDYYDAKPENLGMATVNIAKQRNGPTGEIRLRFSKPFVRFDNLETVHSEE
ncbi:MAG: replicative DNA helicase [Candidatus Omnitrophica bacterium]|nr:replicative DNA helicase [Candidatus Omnitrophota bacterium]